MVVWQIMPASICLFSELEFRGLAQRVITPHYDWLGYWRTAFHISSELFGVLKLRTSLQSLLRGTGQN